MSFKTAGWLIIERCLSGCAIFKPRPFHKFQTADMGRGDGYGQHKVKFRVS